MTKNYNISKVSETLIEEQQWTTIDNDKKYHNWVKLIADGEVFCEEYDEENEELTNWDIADYSGLISKVEKELCNYFEKNNISHDDGVETTWEDQPNITNGYGVKYIRHYHNVRYNADLTEKQVEELENMEYDVTENDN